MVGRGYEVKSNKHLFDGIEISEFHPDLRIAALVLGYPQTWRNFIADIDWSKAEVPVCAPARKYARCQLADTQEDRTGQHHD